MHNSRLPVRKWVIAVYLVTSSSKGFSSYSLARILGVTQTTAWYMLTRLREGFVDVPAEKLTGPVEADETYGGKAKNKPLKKRRRFGRGAIGKRAMRRAPLDLSQFTPEEVFEAMFRQSDLKAGLRTRFTKDILDARDAREGVSKADAEGS